MTFFWVSPHFQSNKINFDSFFFYIKSIYNKNVEVVCQFFQSRYQDQSLGYRIIKTHYWIIGKYEFVDNIT